MTRLLTLLLLLVPFCLHAESQPISELGRIGQYDVEEQDFVYAVVDGIELRAHSYRPAKSAGALPAVVELHGGAWNLYDRTAGALYNKALASAGLYVMAVDFRQGPDHQHPLGSRDATAAVRYLKIHAKRLSLDMNSIGLIGSSSGGHLALLAGLKPNSKMHLGTPIAMADNKQLHADQVDQVDASVKYIIALWPVSDPEYRYTYAKEVKRDSLVQMHDNYFGNIAAMRDASIQRILKEEIGTKAENRGKLPAVLVVQPGEDGNIPRPMTFALLDALQNSQVDTDYLFYPGMPHAFAHRPSQSTDDCIQAMRDFIARQIRSR